MLRLAHHRPALYRFTISLALVACGSAGESGPAGAPSSTGVAGAAAPAETATSIGAVSAGTPAATSGSAGEPGVPCEVTKALRNACHGCHGAVPANGAPMSLVTVADFQVLSVQRDKIPKYEQALMRLDGRRNPPMPPASSPITEADKKTLIDWLGMGAPAATSEQTTCPSP